jgi:Staygreen protein
MAFTLHALTSCWTESTTTFYIYLYRISRCAAGLLDAGQANVLRFAANKESRMNRERRLKPEKLHVNYKAGAGPAGPICPRLYTFTHSDVTAELFLTIGPDCNESQICGWYTKLMRDEVLGEWEDADDGPALHIYCHVSGGLVFGSALMRDKIFRHELPLVLEAIRYGDGPFFAAHQRLDNAPIWVHFESTAPRYGVTERWGVPADYRHE